MSEAKNACETLLSQWLEHAGRGAAAELCLHTSLTESDVSNWLSERRALPEHKLLEAICWLLASGKVVAYFP